MIWLDALDPGSPEQLLAACSAAGAGGALGYVWRGGDIGQWDRAHFDALRNAGLRTAPIGVPAGDGSTPPLDIVAAAHSFGFSGGPLVVDMEAPGNLPPASWWNDAVQAIRRAGFQAVKYGNAGDVGGYQNADGWWIASYIQHAVKPLPTKNAYYLGWQYADQVQLGGVTYDASIFDDSFAQEVEDLTPEQDATLNRIYNAVYFGADGIVGDSYLKSVLAAGVGDIQQKLAAIPAGGGLSADQAAALQDIKSAADKLAAILK